MLCQQLIEEQEKLKLRIRSQEEVIEELKAKPSPAPVKQTRPIRETRSAKIRVQHEEEKNKQSSIDQKIESARRRRIENAMKASNARKTSEPRTQVSVNVKEARTKSAHIPTPEPYDRHNLDTAGKSSFIYPNAEGIFQPNHVDELDRFMNEFNLRASLNRMSSAHSPATSFNVTNSRLLFTTVEANRRENRPVIAKGLPGVFQRPA